MHILFRHGNELLSNFKSLARFANQGVENTHRFENLLQVRDSNRGGRPKQHKVSMNEQIMLSSLRRLGMLKYLKQSTKQNHVELMQGCENRQQVERRHKKKVSFSKRQARDMNLREQPTST